MPRYFIHLHADQVLLDATGQELAGPREARVAARLIAYELIAEYMCRGIVVDLNHRLEIVDDHGDVVMVVGFAEMFTGVGTAA